MLDFNQLYKSHFSEVCKSVNRIVRNEEDANDITQEAFIRAYNNLDTFRGESSFRTWVTSVAINLSINFLHKEKRRIQTTPLKEIDGEILYPSGYKDICSPEDTISAMETEAEIEDKILNLPDYFKEPLLLREVENKSYKEISEQLDLPFGTVKSRISRARRKILEGS